MLPWQNQLAPGSYRRILFDSLPAHAFIDLSQLESFSSRHTALLALSRPATPEVGLSFSRSVDLPFGEFQVVECGGLAIGYLILAPRCQKRVLRNCASLVRRSDVGEVRRVFIDGSMIILGNDSFLMATIVAPRARRWVGGQS